MRGIGLWATLIVVGVVLLVALGGFSERPWLIVLVLLIAAAGGFVLTRAAGRD